MVAARGRSNNQLATKRGIAGTTGGPGGTGPWRRRPWAPKPLAKAALGAEAFGEGGPGRRSFWRRRLHLAEEMQVVAAHRQHIVATLQVNLRSFIVMSLD